jgi:hypothetical protein
LTEHRQETAAHHDEVDIYAAGMDAVNRPEDDELCGFVDDRPDGWHALTVFGASLGVHPTRLDAEKRVVNEGLAALMERWILTDGSTEEIVCIQEAHPDAITVVVGYYALPGVPTMRIDRAELDARRWTLRKLITDGIDSGEGRPATTDAVNEIRLRAFAADS